MLDKIIEDCNRQRVCDICIHEGSKECDMAINKFHSAPAELSKSEIMQMKEELSKK